MNIVEYTIQWVDRFNDNDFVYFSDLCRGIDKQFFLKTEVVSSSIFREFLGDEKNYLIVSALYQDHGLVRLELVDFEDTFMLITIDFKVGLALEEKDFSFEYSVK